jgi:hypothetical protein
MALSGGMRKRGRILTEKAEEILILHALNIRLLSEDSCTLALDDLASSSMNDLERVLCDLGAAVGLFSCRIYKI